MEKFQVDVKSFFQRIPHRVRHLKHHSKRHHFQLFGYFSSQIKIKTLNIKFEIFLTMLIGKNTKISSFFPNCNYFQNKNDYLQNNNDLHSSVTFRNDFWIFFGQVYIFSTLTSSSDFEQDQELLVNWGLVSFFFTEA